MDRRRRLCRVGPPAATMTITMRSGWTRYRNSALPRKLTSVTLHESRARPAQAPNSRSRGRALPRVVAHIRPQICLPRPDLARSAGSAPGRTSRSRHWTSFMRRCWTFCKALYTGSIPVAASTQVAGQRDGTGRRRRDAQCVSASRTRADVPRATPSPEQPTVMAASVLVRKHGLGERAIVVLRR